MNNVRGFLRYLLWASVLAALCLAIGAAAQQKWQEEDIAEILLVRPVVENVISYDAYEGTDDEKIEQALKDARKMYVSVPNGRGNVTIVLPARKLDFSKPWPTVLGSISIVSSGTGFRSTMLRFRLREHPGDTPLISFENCHGAVLRDIAILPNLQADLEKPFTALDLNSCSSMDIDKIEIRGARRGEKLRAIVIRREGKQPRNSSDSITIRKAQLAHVWRGVDFQGIDNSVVKECDVSLWTDGIAFTGTALNALAIRDTTVQKGLCCVWFYGNVAAKRSGLIIDNVRYEQPQDTSFPTWIIAFQRSDKPNTPTGAVDFVTLLNCRSTAKPRQTYVSMVSAYTKIGCWFPGGGNEDQVNDPDPFFYNGPEIADLTNTPVLVQSP